MCSSITNCYFRRKKEYIKAKNQKKQPCQMTLGLEFLTFLVKSWYSIFPIKLPYFSLKWLNSNYFWICCVKKGVLSVYIFFLIFKVDLSLVISPLEIARHIRTSNSANDFIFWPNLISNKIVWKNSASNGNHGK